jgi:threonine efflux protein
MTFDLPLASLSTVFALHWAVLLSPGVNTLLVAQLAASGQPRSAAAASVGISSIALAWATLAALGVGAVFSAHPSIRLSMQVACGLYLLWIATKLWRGSAGALGTAAPMRAAQALRMGLLTNATNPKTALFFGSVFATALPHSASWALIASAVALMWLNSLVWHLLLTAAFSRQRIQHAYAAQGRILSRVASLALGAFGLRMLIQSAQEARQRIT